MRLQVTLDGAEALQAKLDALGRDMPRAIVRAVNRTAERGRTQVVRTVARLTRLPQARFRRNVTIKRATFRDQTAELRIRGHWIPLIAFVPTARRGRAVSVPPGLPVRPKVATAPFVATMPSGHTGIYARRLPTRSRRGKPRSSPALPIEQLFGPSVPELVQRDLPSLELDLSRELRTRLEHEITQLGQTGALAAETA